MPTVHLCKVVWSKVGPLCKEGAKYWVCLGKPGIPASNGPENTSVQHSENASSHDEMSPNQHLLNHDKKYDSALQALAF